MVGSHKILTVSYGTFSCTLEGFEDSFETMKAIAEYFRDLAADDRYFGAEPPQPDAEMLARIAEREVARRVEARMEPSGIVLRVGQSLDAAPQPHPAPAPVEPAPAPAAAMPPAPQPAPEPPPADSVAAKLQRIRAVVGKSATAPVPAEPVVDATAVEDSDDSAMIEAQIDAALAAAIATPVEEPAPVSDTPVAEATDDEPAAQVEDTEPVATIDDLPEEPAPVAETMAAPEPAEPAPAMSEDEPTAEAPAPRVIRARVIRMRKDDFDRAMAAGAIVADAEGTELDTTDAAPAMPVDLAADLDSDLDLQDEAEADLADLAALDDVMPAVDGPTELSPDEEADLLAELAAVEQGIDLDLDLPEIPTVDDLPPDLEAELAEIEDHAATAPDGDLSEQDLLAEVMRAVEAAPAAEHIDQPEPALFEPEAEAETDETRDTAPDLHDADDVAEPAEEIAAETQPEPAVEPVSEPEPDMADDDVAAPAAQRSRFVAPEEDEAALDRILSQTDAQMAGPDAARRRESMAQLRAAVAATEAARALGETPETPAESEDDFREDLRQAVRPRRPVTGAPAERGERPRPAPLKLVASQRIDIPVESPVAPAAQQQPIRPRRVTRDQSIRDDAPVADTAAMAAASDSFADFAERMGAASLADLLEAAAAYTNFVEGSEDFSRPQILRKVTLMAPDTSREDGLRSFGTLLREGRIRRSPRAGRFEVAEDTRFNPDRRAV